MRRSFLSLPVCSGSTALGLLLFLAVGHAADSGKRSNDPRGRPSEAGTDGLGLLPVRPLMACAATSPQLRYEESLGANRAADDPQPIRLTGEIEQVQQVPPVRPPQPLPPEAPMPTPTAQLSASLFGAPDVNRSLLAQDRRDRATGPGTDVIAGAESQTRVTSDAGSLLGKSGSSTGVETQKRTPIVTDPRARGTRTGQLLASGSYWFPARQDLDTMLSKIDSSIIENMIVIKGPYSSRYGPGLSFIDMELLGAPRYADGLEWHGRTSMNYQTNGQQFYGRQSVQGGAEDWGMRFGYGHRTGNDYETGAGVEIPASYNSRDFDAAIGVDLSPDSHLDFSYLRLDQTGVEFPGQFFDIDFLVTDAYEMKYVLEHQPYFDRLRFDTWYNRTRFEGNAQRSGKRRQIPELADPLDFVAFTDVDASSAGYRLAVSWGEADCGQLTVGADMRYLKQELNEISDFNTLSFDPLTGTFTTIRKTGVSSPIPDSHENNPGLFVEYILPVGERVTVKTGGRVDLISTNAARFVSRTDNDGNGQPDDLEALLGGGFEQNFTLCSGFVTAEYRANDCVTALAGFGTAQRPPTLTELYAAGPFLAILQQGFSAVLGDPNLSPERSWQIDLGLKANSGSFRGGISGFTTWVHDYVTYEAVQPQGGLFALDAVVVRFTNTELATLAGGEIYGEYDWKDWLTPFATMSYVEGRDHSRGGRGFFRGADHEPLPGIPPLEARTGLRLHESCEIPRWGVELSARIVDEQDRVATSLLERTTPGFTTYDLRGYWRARERLLLVAGVENFTDKNYREHLDLRTGHGVFQPGVNFYSGFELSY